MTRVRVDPGTWSFEGEDARVPLPTGITVAFPEKGGHSFPCDRDVLDLDNDRVTQLRANGITERARGRPAGGRGVHNAPRNGVSICV